jgi:hypothetical protein
MRFDEPKLGTLLGEGIAVSRTQIRLSYKRVKGWQGVLEGLLIKIG